MRIPKIDIIDLDLTRGRRERPRRRIAAFATAAVVAGSITALSVYGADQTAPVSVVLAEAAAGAQDRTVGANIDSYAPVVERVAPTVVTIRSERRVRAAQQFPFAEDPLFRRFFGDRLPQAPEAQPRREGGLGSGVIVNADGYILTNHHVIDGAEEITVELTDGRSFDARMVGSDPPSDLAVLKINGHGFPALPLGNSDQVRVGDVVLAVGNPMGVGQTVTMGIISAKGRATGLGDGSFEDFLQTDAPINHGNSGGALVNTRGELVGINSQILSPSGGNIGIGFAIPANMAKNVFHALVTDGRVHRSMLGVTVQPITADLAKSLGLEAVRGALVNGVQPGGAADEAGIERGDIIVAINGERVNDTNALRNKVASLKPGTVAKLTVVRDRRERTLSARLEELPAEKTATDRGGPGSSNSGAGLSVEPLTPQRARQLGIEAETGLLVTSVDPTGPAADAGFRRGDVILEVDGTKIGSAAELRRRLSRTDGRPALVLVRRGDATLYLTLTNQTT